MRTNEPRPISPADHITEPWWEATREERLLIQRCDACAHHQLYPRAICTACGSTELGFVEASGRGVVYSWTEVQRAPHPAFNPPYLVAIVRLEEGPLMLSNIVGSKQIACEQSVHLVWEAIQDGRKIPLFAPTP